MVEMSKMQYFQNLSIKYCAYMEREVFLIISQMANRCYFKLTISSDFTRKFEIQFRGVIIDLNHKKFTFADFHQFCDLISSRFAIKVAPVPDYLYSYFSSSKTIIINEEKGIQTEMLIGASMKYIFNGIKKMSDIFPITLLKVTNPRTGKILMVGENELFELFDINKHREKLKPFLLEDKGSASQSRLPSKFSAIFTPDVSSILLHEACGHFLEADMLDRVQSPFRYEDLGKRVTYHGLDITNECKGKYIGAEPFDDEGTIGENEFLIKDGKLASFMVDNIYSKKYGIKPKGNYRTLTPLDGRPHVRMTNVSVTRSDTAGGLFNSNEYDLILTGANKLVVRNNGDFELLIDSAIVDNEIRVHNIIYSDNIRNFLSKIVAVNDDYCAFTGICYKGGVDMKGEHLFVTNIAPSLHVDDLSIRKQ